MSARIFLLECSAPHWISAGKQLAESEIHIVYWTGWNKLSDAVRKNFPACIFHDTLFAKRALDFNGSAGIVGPFDETCEVVWREDAQVVYDMMNRFDNSRDLTHVERSLLFYQCLIYWVSTIKEFSPDLIVFPAPPHVVYDYIALCAARRMGVCTLMFEEIPCMPPYSLFMKDYRHGLNNFRIEKNLKISDVVKDTIKKMRGNYSTGLPNREALVREEMTERLQEGMQGLLERRDVIASIDKKNKGSYDSNEKIVNVSSLHKERGQTLRRSFEGDFANTRYMDQMLADRAVTDELSDYYHSRITSATALDNFIYFPLAGQPERTSNPQADIFSNQILVANLIAHSTPPQLSIVVKEHPNQFHPNFAVNMCRSVEYYQELKNNPRVTFVASLHDSFDLIDRSIAVATTGGTAGIEAVARGKPVLLFGDSWYRNCPGVYRVKNAKDVSEILGKILAREIAICANDIADYLESLARFGFRGIADYPPAGFPVAHDENIINLVKVINQALVER